MYLARKYYLGTLFFTSPNEDGTAIFLVIRAKWKYSRLQGKGSTLYFSVILRPWVLVLPRESKPRPHAAQSSALPTELSGLS